MGGVLGDTVNRANLHALRLVMKSDAFRAFVRIDMILILSLADGLVGALRLTNATIDAFITDY